MNDSLNIVRLILIILFGGYQFWAFKNKKPVKCKLYPMILMFVFGLLTIALASFAGYYLIFVILIIELSLIGVILVVAIEICLALFGADRNLRRVMTLAVVFILLVVVYYLAERVI